MYAEAALAYQQALDVFTREQHPAVWVHLHFALGNVLMKQWERAQGQEKMRLRERVIAAYQQATAGLSRVRQPSEWTLGQLLLG